MSLEQDSYVKIVGVNGDFRYGYVQELLEGGWLIVVSLYDEGASKIGYDEEQAKLEGETPIDWADFLTESEKRVIPLLADNLTPKQIAERLEISPVTVRFYLRTLRLKLDVENKAQLVALAQGVRKVLQLQTVEEAS